MSEPARKPRTPPEPPLRAPRLVAPAPSTPRPAFAVLDECGPAGWLVWTLLEAVRLWAQADDGPREGLFDPASGPRLERAAHAVRAWDGELGGLLEQLVEVCRHPERLAPADVAEACWRIMRWAVPRGHAETAIQFAEAAAVAEPTSATRAYAAGRENRDAGDFDRAAMWFRRAARLARIAGDESAFSIAHLGWGTLMHNLGDTSEAEKHFLKAGRAALRARNRGLAGTAHHDLLGVMVTAGNHLRAAYHAQRALAIYPRGHHRIPHLAFDVGFLWMRMHHFSTAIYLFERTLPLFQQAPESLLIHSALARCVAAVHDRVRFERLAEDVLRLGMAAPARTSSSLLHLANGAIEFGLWARAEALCMDAIAAAEREQNQAVVREAGELLASVAARVEPAPDLIPERDGPVATITAEALRKLDRRNRPRAPR